MADGDGSNNWSYKTCKIQSKCHHQQTNTHLFSTQHDYYN